MVKRLDCSGNSLYTRPFTLVCMLVEGGIVKEMYLATKAGNGYHTESLLPSGYNNDWEFLADWYFVGAQPIYGDEAHYQFPDSNGHIRTVTGSLRSAGNPGKTVVYDAGDVDPCGNQKEVYSYSAGQALFKITNWTPNERYPCDHDDYDFELVLNGGFKFLVTETHEDTSTPVPTYTYDGWVFVNAVVLDALLVEVSVSVSDVSKEYDGVGWSFSREEKNFTAGDGTSVPVTITYSPSTTPKDVGEYEITASFEISSDPAYVNYYLEEEELTFTATIEPYPVTLPCIFSGDQEKVYDGQPFSLPSADSLVTFQTINNNTEEVEYQEVVTLQIVYDPDIRNEKDVFGPVRVTTRYEGMDAYPNYDFTEPSNCSATFEITCRPLTLPEFVFPDVADYFDSCGNLNVEEGTDIANVILRTGNVVPVGNVVDGDTVDVVLRAEIGHYSTIDYDTSSSVFLSRLNYGIRLYFSHNNTNYCPISDATFVYRYSDASNVLIEPFGAEWYNSQYTGPVSVPEWYVDDDGISHKRDVYYSESFTFVLRCKRYSRPDAIIWDDSEVIPFQRTTSGGVFEFIKSEPYNCYEAYEYYRFTINSDLRSEGGHAIAHRLQALWLRDGTRFLLYDTDALFSLINSFDYESEIYPVVANLGYVAPFLGISYMYDRSYFYDADYDGREHCPVVYPRSTETYIYLNGEDGIWLDIDDEAYWCWINDEWAANYTIKDAGNYPINRFQQNANNRVIEGTGSSPYWVGIYGEGTATIHKLTLTITPFKIIKKWDGGTGVDVEVPDRNISGWGYGDSSCQVLARGTFPSSDIGEYLVAENNGVNVSFGVSCSSSNYVIEPAVFDGEIIPSASLFDLFFVDEEGNADVTVVCEGNACSTVYDAKTHYVTIKVKEFDEGELSPGMVEWINGVTIEADKLLWTVNEGEEEETVEGEERVGKLHAGTYLISGYMDFGGSYDLVGQVTFTIGRRPLYLENLTVSYS